MNEKNNNEPEKKRSDVSIFIRLLIISIVLTAIFNIINTYRILRQTTEVSYSTFIDWIDKDYVKKVEFQSDRIEITLKADAKPETMAAKLGTTVFRTGYLENDELIPLLLEY